MVAEELAGEVEDVGEAGDVGAVEAVVEVVEVVVSTYKYPGFLPSLIHSDDLTILNQAEGEANREILTSSDSRYDVFKPLPPSVLLN